MYTMFQKPNVCVRVRSVMESRWDFIVLFGLLRQYNYLIMFNSNI